MSDEMVIEGKTYISSKRAAQISGYAQDYIGQLARGGAIDGQRVGGLWFVNLDSIQDHQTKSEEERSRQAQAAAAVSTKNADPDTFVGLDGKSYISANRASKLSGYNQDYVGQLARAGQIDSRQVGTRWYVNQDSLLAHKEEKDALLASVQRDAVGLHLDEQSFVPHTNRETDLMRYFADEKDLIPAMQQSLNDAGDRPVASDTSDRHEDAISLYSEPQSVSIRRGPHQPVAHALILKDHHRPVSRASTLVVRRSLLPMVTTMAGAALTIVIVLSFGFTSLKSQSTYASATNTSGLVGAAASAVESCARFLELMLTKELRYIRNN